MEVRTCLQLLRFPALFHSWPLKEALRWHPVLADQNFERSNIPVALDDCENITSTLFRVYSLVHLLLKYLVIEKILSFAHTEAYAIHHIIYIENKRALK